MTSHRSKRVLRRPLAACICASLLVAFIALPAAATVGEGDGCGIYFGTTGGQVYASADAGDSWAPIVRDLPAVLSVEVQTLP